MPIMEISIVPIGTKSPSVSKYVAISEKTLKRCKGLNSKITAMGTLIEADSLSTLFDAAARMHESVLASGARRVLTHIAIDERLDKKSGIREKVASVKRKVNCIPQRTKVRGLPANGEARLRRL